MACLFAKSKSTVLTASGLRHLSLPGTAPPSGRAKVANWADSLMIFGRCTLKRSHVMRSSSEHANLGAEEVVDTVIACLGGYLRSGKDEVKQND